MNSVKTIFFLLLLSNINYIFSQHSFKLLIQSQNDERPFEAVQMVNGDYIIISSSRNESAPYFSKILKVSQQGNLIDEISLINPEGDCSLLNLISIGENAMVAVGEWKHPGMNSEIWYVGFDSLLNVLWERKYQLPKDWVGYSRSFINSQGNIVTGISVAQFPYVSTSVLFFIESNIQGDSLKGNIIDPPYGTLFFDFDKVDDYYIATVDGFSLAFGPDIVYMDTLFNITSIKTITYDLYFTLTRKEGNNNSYFMAGNYKVDQSYIAVGLFNDSNVVQYFTYDTLSEYQDYGGSEQSMDIVSPDTIITAGTHNYDNYTLYSSRKSWFALYNYDSLLDMRWKKYFGGDAYYFLMHVLATTDGGALLSGIRYDSEHPENFLDIYLVKVTNEGVVTSLDDPSENPDNRFMVYPNPGNDFISVSGPGSNAIIRFDLYDTQGRQIIRKTTSSKTTIINTVNLTPGLYLWTISVDEQVIQTGKWVKNSD